MGSLLEFILLSTLLCCGYAQDTSKPKVTLQDSWSEMYVGETITLRCDIKGGEDKEWEYEWPSHIAPHFRHKNMIRVVTTSRTVDSSCQGRTINGISWTEWSEYLRVTLSERKPKPVLTTSALWPSPGDSLNLTCNVSNPSAGWRFYWFRVLPNLSSEGYTYEELPGTNSGTEQYSYSVGGQGFTSGYVCRAGRGNPVFYTDYSQETFVWSAERRWEASLTVSPNRSQHLTTESVSLRCEGNSTEWRVVGTTEERRIYWTMRAGEACDIRPSPDRVYWCESGTGQFSNAVNVSRWSSDIILISPVHPVTEGDPVTLGCKVNKQNKLTLVRFYKNDKLLETDGQRNLTLLEVSKSDEGLYKCEVDGGLTSAASWLSVKSKPATRSPSSSLLLITGLVGGVLLTGFLLLLLYKQVKTKGSCFTRSARSSRANQGSDIDHVTDGDGTQCKDASPLQDHSTEVTYTSVVLKNVTKGANEEQQEDIVYLNVKLGATAGNPANEIVYSEVKAGAASAR